MTLPIAVVLTNFQGIRNMARNLTGRNDSDASNPITDAVAGQFINFRQRQVAMLFPRIRDLIVDDAGSILSLSTDDYTYDLGSYSGNVNQLLEVWRVKSATSERNRLRFLPLNEFDKRFHPTTTGSSGLPTWYTRRNNVIEVAPKPSSSYNGHGLRLVYSKWPAIMEDVTNTTPDISGIEQALVAGAIADLYKAIGNEPERVGFWEAEFTVLAKLTIRNQMLTPDWGTPQVTHEMFSGGTN